MSQLAAVAAARAALLDAAGSEPDGKRLAGALAEVPLFETSRGAISARIAKLAREAAFCAGLGDRSRRGTGTSFYVLLDGMVRVVRAGGRSRSSRAGDFFGEMALLDDAPRSASVVADGEVLTMTIGRSAFSKLLKHEPTLT